MIILGNTKLTEECGKLQISGNRGLRILITLINYKWEKYKSTSLPCTICFVCPFEASVQSIVLMYLVLSLFSIIVAFFKNWNKKLESYKNFPISSKSHRKQYDGKWKVCRRMTNTPHTQYYFLIPSPWRTSSLMNYRILAHRDHKGLRLLFL